MSGLVSAWMGDSLGRNAVCCRPYDSTCSFSFRQINSPPPPFPSFFFFFFFLKVRKRDDTAESPERSDFCRHGLVGMDMACFRHPISPTPLNNSGSPFELFDYRAPPLIPLAMRSPDYRIMNMWPYFKWPYGHPPPKLVDTALWISRKGPGLDIAYLQGHDKQWKCNTGLMKEQVHESCKVISFWRIWWSLKDRVV